MAILKLLQWTFCLGWFWQLAVCLCRSFRHQYSINTVYNYFPFNTFKQSQGRICDSSKSSTTAAKLTSWLNCFDWSSWSCELLLSSTSNCASLICIPITSSSSQCWAAPVILWLANKCSCLCSVLLETQILTAVLKIGRKYTEFCLWVVTCQTADCTTDCSHHGRQSDSAPLLLSPSSPRTESTHFASSGPSTETHHSDEQELRGGWLMSDYCGL